MKKLVLGVLLLGIAAVVSLKGYAWFQVYEQLKVVKQKLAPFATFKYSWIYSTFDGEIGVRGIEITPYRLKDTITIDEISLKVKDAVTLFKLKDNLSNRYLPNQLQLRMENMSVPVTGELSKLQDSIEAYSEEQTSAGQFNPFQVYACGSTSTVTADELMEMGYDKFTASSELTYRLEPLTNKLIVTGVMDSDSMGRSELGIELGVAESNMNVLLASGKMPEINEVKWEFHDGGYFRRLSYFCGKQTGVDREAYAKLAAREWSADLQEHGITLNPNLVEAYRHYILDGGLFSIKVSPDRDIDYSTLSLFSANDIVNMLNLQIAINGEPVTDLAMSFDDSKVAGMFGEKEKPAAVNNEVVSSQTEPAVMEEPQKSYQPITIEEATNYLKYPVWIEIDTGKQVEGAMVAIDEYIIEVEQIVSGGKVSYPIRKRNITSIKVWK